MALEHSISSHYSTVCRLRELRATGEEAMLMLAFCTTAVRKVRHKWENKNKTLSTEDFVSRVSLPPFKYHRWQKENILNDHSATLRSEEGEEVLTGPVMPMQAANGLNGVPTVQHANHLSMKTGRDMTLKPISLRPKYCTRSPHFTVCGRAGLKKKSHISFFFPLKSSYPTAQIPVTFHTE